MKKSKLFFLSTIKMVFQGMSRPFLVTLAMIIFLFHPSWAFAIDKSVVQANQVERFAAVKGLTRNLPAYRDPILFGQFQAVDLKPGTAGGVPESSPASVTSDPVVGDVSPLATGVITLTSGTFNMSIADNNGSWQGGDMTGEEASVGAYVTNLEYRCLIQDDGTDGFSCSDYKICLYSGDTALDVLVYENLGGDTDGGHDDDSEDDYDLYLDWRSTNSFSGETPNQKWGILCQDSDTGNDGQLTYVEFKVYWETPEVPELAFYDYEQWDDLLPIGIESLNYDVEHSYSGPYYSNQPLYFNWGSHNQGEAQADNYTVRVEVTNSDYDYGEWSGLYTAPGSWTIPLTTDQEVGPLTPGEHTFKIWLDYNDSVTEGNENNNYYERTIIVEEENGEPEIRIEPTSLDFIPDPLPLQAASQNTAIKTTTSKDNLQVNAAFKSEELSFTIYSNGQMVNLPKTVLPEDKPGTPWLPAQYINVLLPAGTRVASLTENVNELLVAEDIVIRPVQPPVRPGTPLKTPTLPDLEAYDQDVLTPQVAAEVVGHHTMRGMTYVSLRLNPLRYNPYRQKLYLATTLRLNLTLENKGLGKLTPTANNDLFKRMVTRLVVNPEALPAAERQVEALLELPVASTVDYLVITSSALADTFQVLANHRFSYTGLSSQVLTVENIYYTYDGIDNQERIRNCIKDYVANYGTVYVVLGGDDTVVPDRDCYVKVLTSGGWETEEHMPTDLYYAGLDGTWDEDGDWIYGEADTSFGDEGDLAPDVIVGRIPVRTVTDAASYINKLITYEMAPPDAAFRGKFMFMGMNLWDTYSGNDRPSDILDDDHLGFRDHDPVSDGEMWIRRLYRDGIQPYAEPSSLAYFFDTLSSWDSSIAGDYSQDTGNVTVILNEGWQNLFVGTHGWNNSWSLESGVFFSSNAASLTARTTIVYTMACLTGYFDGTTDPCLSEAFLRNSIGGALAYFGCSRFGWGSSDPSPASNDSTGGTSIEYAYQFYDEMLNGGSEMLGQIFSQHKANMAGECDTNGSHRWVQFGLNYQGDPAFRISGDFLASQAFTIFNDGTAILNVSEMAKRDNDSWFSWSPQAPLNIAPGGSEIVNVTVYPSLLEPGVNQDQILVTSNDADESLYPDAVYINVGGPANAIYIDKPTSNACSGFTPCYSPIQAGFDAAADGNLIMVTAEIYVDEDLIFGNSGNVAASLKGGLDDNYGVCIGTTMVDGMLSIIDGTLIVEALVIH